MKFKESALKTPILSAIAYSLFFVALFSLPNIGVFSSDNAKFFAEIACRTVAIVLALIVAKLCGFNIFSFKKIRSYDLILLFLGFLVCVNNFPIIGYITKNVTLTDNPKIALYTFRCLFIGVSEETVFRAFILPLVAEKFKGEEKITFKAVLISSAIFSACHIFNVFGSGIGATLLQVGYTFLTGGLFGIAYVITGNFIVPSILHFIFDIGGLAFLGTFHIFVGNMWDIYTIIITAVLGIFVTAAYLIRILGYNKVKQEGEKAEGQK